MGPPGQTVTDWHPKLADILDKGMGEAAGNLILCVTRIYWVTPVHPPLEKEILKSENHNLPPPFSLA